MHRPPHCMYPCSLSQGASPRELVVEACRRDQPHLIEQVLADMESQTNEQVAQFFNEVADSMGNYALHICAQYGSCEYQYGNIGACLSMAIR